MKNKIKRHYSRKQKARADCDAPCFEQLMATHLRASPKQQALLDVLLQLIKTWPLTIGPCPHVTIKFFAPRIYTHGYLMFQLLPF